MMLLEKLLLTLVIIALILQTLNMLLLGGIPLFDSVLKSRATTNIWRIAYPLFLIMMNLLLAKYYDKKDKNFLVPEKIIAAYKKFKAFAHKYYPDIEIISINPVGLKGLFKDVEVS